ncbi:10936_t:CDS:2 [Ambispora gerdemannii]|uniref:10936_t:CDS:1 n=1 Tax=Ambispora gerdemannii TaxID=144530 RepID=A0A9N9F648_9GLOM|nr:10936_t:CDS:2 [Ambispora gerdemannii]
MELFESEIASVDEARLRKRRSKFGICLECHHPRTGDGWCQPCNARRLAAIRLDGVQKIGAGGYGTVYKATWNAGRGSNLVVVQHRWQHESRLIVVALKTLVNSEHNEELIHESRLILQSIKVHLRAFQCHGVTRNPATNQYMMVVQYVSQVPTGELKNYLNRGFQDLRWKNRIVNLLYIASDLKVLHQVGLVHGDLNSGNLLVHGTALNGIRGTRQPTKTNPPTLSNGKRENGNVDSDIFVQFEEAELKRQEASRKFPKPPKKPTHPHAVYHSRLLSVVSISENGKIKGRAETVYFDAEPSEEPEFSKQDLALKHLVPAKSLPRPATIYQRRSLPNVAVSNIVTRLSARKSTSNINSTATRISNRMATVYFDADLADLVEDDESLSNRPRSKWKQPGEGDVPPLPPLPPLLVQSSNDLLAKETASSESTVSSPQSENLPTPIESPSSPRGEDAIACKGKESDYAKKFNSESTTTLQSTLQSTQKDNQDAELVVTTVAAQPLQSAEKTVAAQFAEPKVEAQSDEPTVEAQSDEPTVEAQSAETTVAAQSETTVATQSAETTVAAQSAETTVAEQPAQAVEPAKSRKSKERGRSLSKRSYPKKSFQPGRLAPMVSDVHRTVIDTHRTVSDSHRTVSDSQRTVSNSHIEDSEWANEVFSSIVSPHDEDTSTTSNSSQSKADSVKSSAVSKTSVEPPKLLDIPLGLQNQGTFEKLHAVPKPRRRRFKFIRQIFKKLSFRSLFRCGANRKDISLEEFEEY